MPGLLEFLTSTLATVQIVLDAENAGGGLLSLGVSSIDDAIVGLEGRGLDPQRDDTTSDTVRLGMLRDPDGNRITFPETRSGSST